MLCLLCQRLYIPLIYICYAFWVCLRQSASHVPKYFWHSLLSLILWSMEKDLKYFMRYISWSISSWTNICRLAGILCLNGDCFPWIYTGSLGWWDKWGRLQPLCHCSLLIWRPVCFGDGIDCCSWLQKEPDSCHNTWEYQSTAVTTAGHRDLIYLVVYVKFLWNVSQAQYDYAFRSLLRHQGLCCFTASQNKSPVLQGVAKRFLCRWVD